MMIRHERGGDEGPIAHVTQAAFEGHPHSDGSEAAIVARLRAAGALSLSLVCEEGGSLLGHLALSPVRIGGQEGGWFGLGPISVLPDYQGQGIGSALMRAALEWLRDRQAGGCVLLGEPAVYGRFGFAARQELVLPDVPPEFFLSLPLSEAAASGIVSYHPAFYGKVGPEE